MSLVSVGGPHWRGLQDFIDLRRQRSEGYIPVTYYFSSYVLCPAYDLAWAWFSYAAELPATPFPYEKWGCLQQRPCQSLPPACLRSWLEFNFAGMPAVKTSDVSCCRQRYVLIRRRTRLYSETSLIRTLTGTIESVRIKRVEFRENEMSLSSGCP